MALLGGIDWGVFEIKWSKKFLNDGIITNLFKNNNAVSETGEHLIAMGVFFLNIKKSIMLTSTNVRLFIREINNSVFQRELSESGI